MKKFLLPFLFVALSLTITAQDKPKCKATTKAGVVCKGTPGKDGFCMAHTKTGNFCGAMTSKKTPCKQRVKTAGTKCRFHS
jgi:hypothetical protein